MNQNINVIYYSMQVDSTLEVNDIALLSIGGTIENEVQKGDHVCQISCANWLLMSII